MTKDWISRAKALLDSCLSPVANEVNELDWKSSLSSNRQRLTEHLISFANYPGGGFLVFGIRDSDANLEGMVQLQVSETVNLIANLARDTIEPPIAIDHAVVDYNGVNLLFIAVPESQIRPVHRHGKSIEECWIRSGGTTRKASRQEVATLMMGSRTARWEELRASDEFSVEEVIKKFDLSTLAKLRERPIPEKSPDLVTWMLAEKLVVAHADGFYVTNFGAVAAANNLEEFKDLSRKRIRVIRYRGRSKADTTIDEMEGRRGYAVGFEGLINYLKRVLPHSEVIQESLRTEVSVYPEIALRELIANALIHQDFSITGTGPMIDIFDDRIEFTNPGSLLPTKKLDRLIGTTPESRNEILASAFRQYRICEERGTGFQKVITAAELFGLPPVTFSVLENAFKVTIFAPKKFSDMSQTERIEAAYQHAVLKYFTNSALTNTSLRLRLRLADKQRAQISRLIKEATDSGRIKPKDTESKSSKFSEYLPYWA